LRAVAGSGDVEAHYLESERLRLALTAEQPGAREHRWALATTRLNLSVFYQQDPKRQKEMDRYHDLAATGLEALLRDDANDRGCLEALAVLRVNWSYVLDSRGQTGAAIADLTKSVAPLEALLKHEPGYELARDRLYRTHARRAELLANQGKHVDSAIDWERAVAYTPPGDSRQLRRLFLALAYARAGRHADALREVDALSGPMPRAAPRSAQLMHLAQVCAVALMAAKKDETLPPDDRTKLANAYAAKALDLLKTLRQEVGQKEWATTRQELFVETDFLPFRLRSEFQPLFAP